MAGGGPFPVEVYARAGLGRAVLPGGGLEPVAVYRGRVYPLSLLGFERLGEVLVEVEPGGFEGLAARAARLHRGYPLGSVYLAAPFEGGKLLGVGLNYWGHARETGREPPGEPLVFSVTPNAVVGPVDAVVAPGAAGLRLDVEVELGVVVAPGGRGLTPREAAEASWGFVVVNDVSARAEQFRGGPPRFWRGKSWDTFKPLGPVVVPRTLLDPYRGVRLWSGVSGRRLQDSTTADMIHGVWEVVSYASEAATLAAGDVVFTGTPEGVGHARSPPVYAGPGDVLEACVEGVGCLRNPVVEG